MRSETSTIIATRWRVERKLDVLGHDGWPFDRRNVWEEVGVVDGETRAVAMRAAREQFGSVSEIGRIRVTPQYEATE